MHPVLSRPQGRRHVLVSAPPPTLPPSHPHAHTPTRPHAHTHMLTHTLFLSSLPLPSFLISFLPSFLFSPLPLCSAADEEEGFLVTGSRDATVKTWRVHQWDRRRAGRVSARVRAFYRAPPSIPSISLFSPFSPPFLTRFSLWAHGTHADAFLPSLPPSVLLGVLGVSWSFASGVIRSGGGTPCYAVRPHVPRYILHRVWRSRSRRQRQ